MSSVYAGTETYHGSIVIPSDGDPAVAESVNIALRDLMDNSIVFRTDLEHVAADDRGGIHTIVGAIVWNDGGGSFESNIESTFNGGLHTFGQPLTIHSSSQLECNGPAEFDGNVTVGNTGTDALIVNSSLTQNGAAEFWDPVVLHSGATLEVNANATLEGDLTIIGVDGGTTGLIVYSTAVMAESLVVNGALQVGGNATLGSNASDNITTKGPATFESDVTCEDDLQVDEDLTVSGDASIEGSLVVEDDITCRNLTAEGDTVIGNNSASDTLTINALINAPVGFTSAGRVPQRPTLGPDANTSITVISTNLVFVPFAGLSATRTYTLQDGSVVGDEMLFSSQDTANLLVINPVSGSSSSIKAVTLNVPVWVRFVWFGSTWYAVERSS